LAKSRNFRSLKHKKDQNYPIFIFFLKFDLAKEGASTPLAPSLVAPLDSGLMKVKPIEVFIARF